MVWKKKGKKKKKRNFYLCSLVYKLSVSYSTFPSPETSPWNPPSSSPLLPREQLATYASKTPCWPPGNTSDQTCQFHFQFLTHTNTQTNTHILQVNGNIPTRSQFTSTLPPDVFKVYIFFLGGANQTILRKRPVTSKRWSISRTFQTLKSLNFSFICAGSFVCCCI